MTDAEGRRVDDGGLGRWLTRHAPTAARGTVTIALVSDSAMRRLNRTFRGKDAATDVLSFGVRPQGSGRRRGFGPRAAGARLPASGHELRRSNPVIETNDSLRPEAKGLTPDLGEIAIATGVARRQAREFGHSEHTERRVLALHGLLHLLGYDHDADQGEMEQLEERLRRRAGLPGGLIGRPARALGR